MGEASPKMIDNGSIKRPFLAGVLSGIAFGVVVSAVVALIAIGIKTQCGC